MYFYDIIEVDVRLQLMLCTFQKCPLPFMIYMIYPSHFVSQMIPTMSSVIETKTAN